MRRSACIAVLLALTACNEALMEPRQMGSISLSLSSDVEVVADTRTGTDGVDCSGFLVDIYGTTFLGQTYESDQYIYGTMPESVRIPYGYYRVSAQNCLEETAADGFGCVHYYGESEQVEVLSQTRSDVTVTCRMVNGKVTMTFDESFLEDFSDVTVDITCGRKVTMTSDQANAPAEIYFNVPDEGMSLGYTITGTIAKGTENEKTLTYSNAASPLTLLPAKWARITIKSNHNGIIGPDVTVNGDMGIGDPITEIINPEGGDEVVNGDIDAPSILVDTEISDATVVDCIIDIY